MKPPVRSRAYSDGTSVCCSAFCFTLHAAPPHLGTPHEGSCVLLDSNTCRPSENPCLQLPKNLQVLNIVNLIEALCRNGTQLFLKIHDPRADLHNVLGLVLKARNH